MSKLTTTPTQAMHQQRILANKTVRVALTVAAVLGLLLALLFMVHGSSPVHVGVSGNTWVFQ